MIAEVPLVACLPNICVQKAYLKPMRLQTGGTVLAGKLALERGWAINVGGGFHHCSGNSGGGFCPYADITLLIRCLVIAGLIQNAMIVDLDAHQGNGYQRDFLGVPEVYIMDMYNKHIYPKDRQAKKAIRRKIELNNLVEDMEYMLKLRQNLKAALKEFKPDILVYNAGTDILDSDPLGNLRISEQWSYKVAMIAEVPLVACLPNICVQKAYLKPMRLQTGGTVLAGKLALERGWAINVGGGFHHCSGNSGGGFCPYADITLLIRCLVIAGLIQNAMIVDLDAHQGNGYQRDFLGVPEVYIMDMYNKHIYPKDRQAKKAIRRKIELNNLVEDMEYMLKLRQNLKAALKEFKPDILVYNAGTDILDSDPLGNLRISEQGIILRDEFVFSICKEHHIPIVMVTSGGYLRATARIIAQSILNLREKGLISDKKIK